MISALSVSDEQDLQPLSQYLWSQGIAHRISEQAHQQIIWVAHEQDVALVQAAYEASQRGELPELSSISPSKTVSAADPGVGQVVSKLREVPVISMMLLISVSASLLLLYTGLSDEVFSLFRMGTWGYIFESGQFWRVVTPVFLHFSEMHLAFNMVMLWYFGRQLERREGYQLLIPLLLLFTIVPNLAQYFAEGIRFGGMSGVVYALLGYCWLYNRLTGRALYQFPGAIMGLMVAWLIIGFTGILTSFGFPPMANVAHLGGLVIGLVCAFGANLIRK